MGWRGEKERGNGGGVFRAGEQIDPFWVLKEESVFRKVGGTWKEMKASVCSQIVVPTGEGGCTVSRDYEVGS